MTAVDARVDEGAVPTHARTRGGPLRIVVRLVVGPLRVVIVLAVICAIFQSLNEAFLTAANISNLALQIVPMGIIATGVVLVLLLGQIDLSVGATSGLCGAIMAVLVVNHGWNGYLGILGAVAVGAALGAALGAATTFLQLPSFIVTLAALLAWQGLQILVLGDNGTLNIGDPRVTDLATYRLPNGLAVPLGVVLVLGYAGLQVRRTLRQHALGVEVDPWLLVGAKVVGVGSMVFGGLAVLLADRGVPLALVIFVGLLTVVNAVLTGTVHGRYLMAVGGNAESARRVGIPVRTVLVVTFACTGALAAFGGVMGAARLQAATQAAGGSDLLLLAIASPVIAGVSLFGGRGSVWGALLGAVVIGSISNGMDLLGLDASLKYVVTGAVLFVAVALDAVARLQRRKEGLG